MKIAPVRQRYKQCLALSVDTNPGLVDCCRVWLIIVLMRDFFPVQKRTSMSSDMRRTQKLLLIQPPTSNTVQEVTYCSTTLF